LTDASGQAYEFLLYLPYGEQMASQKAAGYSTPYKFTGKELDIESGLYYFGARYYDPSNSLWHGLDPMMEKYPNLSPFLYTANNPIVRIDPDGRDWYQDNESGSYKWFDDDQCRDGWNHIGKTGNYRSINGPVNLNDNGQWSYANNLPWVRDDYSANSNLWNSPLMRTIVPDKLGLNVSLTGLGNAGASISYNVDWVTRGHDANLLPYVSKTKSALASPFHISFDLGVTGSLSEYATFDMRSLNHGEADNAILGVDYSVTMKETPGVGGSYSFGIGLNDDRSTPNWINVAKAGPSVGFSGGVGYIGINHTTPIYGLFSAFKK
jgi:RHS repeat-associated protein